MARPRPQPRIAFLFLGETLLIPHLYPIVEALAAQTSDVAIECWVATSVHEDLIASWLADAGLGERVRLCRAPGWRDWPDLVHGENPPLPSKIPTLIRLLPHLLRTRIVVCAEQTSLWLPRLLPFLRSRFIMTAHGAGSVSHRADPRRKSAYRLFLPSDFEGEELVRFGKDAARIVTTGYVKAGFRHRSANPSPFRDDRPVLLYTPHWQRHRSSWWRWGRDIVDLLVRQDRWNVVLAPHQRLVERDPEVRGILLAAAHASHVHADLDSFATVDGTYTAMADLYLGDTSSQVGEYLIRPRPCVFLNADALDWRATDDHGFWECGEVVDDLADVLNACDRAAMRHPTYLEAQRHYVATVLGDVSGDAPARAAAAVLAALR